MVLQAGPSLALRLAWIKQTTTEEASTSSRDNSSGPNSPKSLGASGPKSPCPCSYPRTTNPQQLHKEDCQRMIFCVSFRKIVLRVSETDNSRKWGLANGVSPFFSENETEKNGRKRKKRKKRKKKGKNRKRHRSGDPFCETPRNWGTSKQHMKLQQPRTTTFECPNLTSRRPQSGNDREMTTS